MKKLQSGRSMVEMLGVLAIIGVLSVTGIATYTFAMNKYKANEIIANIQRKLPGISTQMIQEVEWVELEEDELFGATIGLSTSTNCERQPAGEAEQFGICVENLNSAVCNNLVNMWEEQVGDSKCDAESESNNYVHYVFNYDLSSGIEEPPVRDPCKPGGKVITCTNGKQCEGGVCKCPGSLKENEKGECVCSDYETHECGGNYYCHFGSAWTCDTSTGKLSKGEGTCVIGSGNLRHGNYVEGIITSVSGMMYWDAVNYCKSRGKNLLQESAVTPELSAALAGLGIDKFWVEKEGKNCNKAVWRGGPSAAIMYAGNKFYAVCN